MTTQATHVARIATAERGRLCRIVYLDWYERSLLAGQWRP